jgi:hypothetical protein
VAIRGPAPNDPANDTSAVPRVEPDVLEAACLRDGEDVGVAWEQSPALLSERLHQRRRKVSGAGSRVASSVGNGRTRNGSGIE